LRTRQNLFGETVPFQSASAAQKSSDAAQKGATSCPGGSSQHVGLHPESKDAAFLNHLSHLLAHPLHLSPGSLPSDSGVVRT